MTDFLHTYWPHLTAAGIYSALKILQLVTGALIAGGSTAKWIVMLNAILVDVLPQLSLPSVRNAPPVVGQTLKVVALGILLAAAPARAQVLSVGASLPMLEFQGQNTHPVTFAPGLGVEAAIGFFQVGLMGKEWDLLDISGQAFANAPGALQAALLVGTFNNIIAIGAAVPLYAADGSGAFNGAFHVYPVLSLSIPIAFGPYSPPTGTQGGPTGLERGGTVYLP